MPPLLTGSSLSMTSNLIHWISHPESLDRNSLYELRTLLARYPYCQSLRLLFLKNLYLLHDVSFGQELRKAAVYVADRKKLFYLIEGDKFVVESVPEQTIPKSAPAEEHGLDRTFCIIDTFLSNMPAEDEELQVDSFQQITDYTVFLQHSDLPEEPVQELSDEVPSPGQDLIDKFIVKAENESMILKPIEEDENNHGARIASLSTDVNFDDDETYFTETLAKIYIKQQRYSKALEIIKKLSLKYPKKNAYFADQIRFLEKVIINAKTK